MKDAGKGYLKGHSFESEYQNELDGNLGFGSLHITELQGEI